uniref:4_1_CTD domain-containing protein n=1 Tax=Elaeophora elaphi TaxID=1147741 RepID=A0A0R3RHF3_9BILA
MKKSLASNGNEKMTSFQTPVVEALDNKLTYKPGVDEINGNDYPDVPGELISSRTVTQGNRTIETITYKTEKNGTVETHVEHRVTIHSCDDIDHDAELSQAILEATNMNPDMTVEKIEVKHESQC